MMLTFALLSFMTASPAAATLAPTAPAAVPVKLSAVTASLRLDDYYFDSTLKKVVVPGGALGKILFVDADSHDVSSIDIFTPPKNDTGTAGGLTSLDAGEGLIFVVNRSDRKLYVADPAENDAQKRIIASAPLAAVPDFIRYVSPTRELWVTEPKKNQIEVFSISASTAMRPITPVQEVLIPSTHGEYESLVIDASRKRAYSNQESSTVAIDLQTKRIVATWKNGCKEATGLALDDARGFLIVACREGRAVVLDVRDGHSVSSLKTGEGVDIIAYSPEKQMVYLPAAKSATVTYASLSEAGELKEVAKSNSAKGAHCVVVDQSGGSWVCDGAAGRLLYFPPLED
ncbi:MAG: YncE family protein [Elusimicrobiota bacterium]